MWKLVHLLTNMITYLQKQETVFALEDGFISQGDDILYEGFTVDNEVIGGIMKAERSPHDGSRWVE